MGQFDDVGIAVSDTPSPTRTRYHHGELRAALVQAGFDLLRERPLSDFSVSEIARRLGVSSAAPYRHFADRDQLLVALATQAAIEITGAMRASVASAGADPVERFAVTAGTYVRFVVSRGAGFNVIFADGLERLHDHGLGAAGRELIDLILTLAVETGRSHSEAVALMEQHVALAHGYVGLYRDHFFARRRYTADAIAELAVSGSRSLARTV